MVSPAEKFEADIVLRSNQDTDDSSPGILAHAAILAARCPALRQVILEPGSTKTASTKLLEAYEGEGSPLLTFEKAMEPPNILHHPYSDAAIASCLRYVYTGSIEVAAGHAAEVRSLCTDFGLDDTTLAVALRGSTGRVSLPMSSESRLEITKVSPVLLVPHCRTFKCLSFLCSSSLLQFIL